MYAPKGFLSLQEVWLRLDDVADRWCEDNPHPHDVKSFEDRNGWAVELPSVRQAALRAWLMHMFLDNQEHAMFACLPDGRALKVSRTFVQRARVFGWPFWDTPENWTDYAGPVEEFGGFSQGEDLPFDSCTFTVARAKILSEVDKGKISTMHATMGALDGLPLCWKLPDDKEPEWLEICSMEAVRMPEDLDARTMNPGNQSKDEGNPVTRILEHKNRNPRIKRDDLKEALFPGMSYRRFKMFWAMASERNPKISKSGRKPIS